ncbi:MAG: hypothetical protein QME40_07165 [bacterium]|nr:hypothetical protein [bacterium]
MIKRVGFSVSANRKIGIGHLIRSLSLASYLKDTTSIEVLFFMKNGGKGKDIVEDRGFEVTSKDDVILKRFKPQIMIIDMREVDIRYIQLLKGRGIKVICLDNVGDSRNMSDIVINGIVHLPYKDSSQPKIYEGPDYIILNSDFVEVHDKHKPIKEKVTKILVTFGGSDPCGLTIKVIDALSKQIFDLEITVVIGILFNGREKLERLLYGKRNLVLREGIKNMASLMYEADLCLTSFGITCYELACAGVPTIIISPTSYHNELAKIFARFGTSIDLGIGRYVTSSKILDAVNSLCNNRALREDMSVSGKRLIDGRGIDRVAKIILDA